MSNKKIIDSFIQKEELNPKFWKDDKLNPKVREKLMKIAEEFIDFGSNSFSFFGPIAREHRKIII